MIEHVTTARLHELFRYSNGELIRKNTTAANAIKGQTVGYTGNHGYKVVSIKKRRYLIHRLIYQMFNNKQPKEIDHIDGIRTNNKIENLRECDRSQNLCNMRLRKDNASGYKGVYLHKQNKNWCAEISYKGTRIRLGSFSSPELASKAVILARNKLHKEFARAE